MNSNRFRAVLAVTALAVLPAIGVGLARAQDTNTNTNQGPMAPPPTFKVHRMPSVPQPGPPPIPVPEMVRKLAANEDAAMKAFATYDFTQTIRVEELDDSGGKFTAIGDAYVKPDGARYWRVTKQPISTLKVASYTLEDVKTMISVPVFFLTSDQVANYNFTFVGQQKLDEINTYIFQVKPKTLSRKQRFFDGIVYLEDQDYAIVESFGKFVSELTGTGTPLPFTMFETYRENFQQKYWLPTYTSSDDYMGKGDDQLHLRLVIRDTDFKPNSIASQAPPSLNHPQDSSNPDTK